MLGVKNEGKKVFFIVNKYAGTGYQPQVEGRIIDTCERYNAECTIEFTRSPGHATTLAHDAAAAGFDFVVAVGGDGTINEVAQGLLHSTTPLGIIPRGSGNGLSRHLGIPLKITGALNTLFNSTVLGMDTFLINGKLSLNVSGIGFDGHIANLFAGKTRRGLAGYTKLTMQEFMQFREFQADVTVDNKPLHSKAFIIAIANSSQYGNNARIAPAASVCDQLLHVSVIKKIPLYRLDFIYSVFNGNIEKYAFCDILEGKSITIKTSTPIAYHVDGEPSGHHDQFNIELLPAALQVLIPNSEGNRGKRIL
jgi:diacylglycerol kinase (ATP)